MLFLSPPSLLFFLSGASQMFCSPKQILEKNVKSIPDIRFFKVDIKWCIHLMYVVCTYTQTWRHGHSVHNVYSARAYTSRDMKTYTVQTQAHKAYHTLLLSHSDWQYSSQTPVDIICRCMRPRCQVPVFAWNKKWDGSQQRKNNTPTTLYTRGSTLSANPGFGTTSLLEDASTDPVVQQSSLYESSSDSCSVLCCGRGCNPVC